MVLTLNGSDVISGGDGFDMVEVEGSLTLGDDFAIGKDNLNRAFFERKGFVGETPGVGRFTLTVDTSEVFEVSGKGGNDAFKVNVLSGTGVELVIFSGGEGDDTFDGSGTNTPLQINGDAGKDTLMGGSGNDVITGGDGVDTLTGGGGSDRFVYSGNPFANGNPALNATTGINVLNTPDTIQDFIINGGIVGR
jgi:Ca2+-binding RTX toxin-like protein